MLYYMGLALAIGIGLPIGVIGAGIGQGLATAFAVQGVARQPEAAGDVRGTMLLTAALVEGVALFVVVICFLIYNTISGMATGG